MSHGGIHVSSGAAGFVKDDNVWILLLVRVDGGALTELQPPRPG